MAIWTDTFSDFAVGTSTDAGEPQDITVPSTAVEICAIKFGTTATAPAVAESTIGRVSLQGQDFNNQPWMAFSEPGASRLSAIGGDLTSSASRWHPCFLPITPGGNFQCVVEMLDQLSDGGRAWIDIKYSSTPTGMAPVNRLCSTETISSTSTGPTLTVTGAKNLTGYGGVYWATTVTADDGSVLRFNINSSALSVVQQLKFHMNIRAIEATSGHAQSYLTQIDCDVPIKNDPAIFTSSVDVDQELDTAGGYAYYVEYNPVSVNR